MNTVNVDSTVVTEIFLYGSYALPQGRIQPVGLREGNFSVIW